MTFHPKRVECDVWPLSPSNDRRGRWHAVCRPRDACTHPHIYARSPVSAAVSAPEEGRKGGGPQRRRDEKSRFPRCAREPAGAKVITVRSRGSTVRHSEVAANPGQALLSLEQADLSGPFVGASRLAAFSLPIGAYRRRDVRSHVLQLLQDAAAIVRTASSARFRGRRCAPPGRFSRALTYGSRVCDLASTVSAAFSLRVNNGMARCFGDSWSRKVRDLLLLRFSPSFLACRGTRFSAHSEALVGESFPLSSTTCNQVYVLRPI